MFFLFADDTNILYADSHLKTLEEIVNQDLWKLCDWLIANNVTLNIKKTNFVQPKENFLSNLISWYLMMTKISTPPGKAKSLRNTLLTNI